ncbi:MAG: cobalt-precorrin-5B (C(1))-methyltransferase [Dehalococcoidales bacterium]|nr:cobalt-precorrin-5B (C(1))-methyltransferase [Dehalococcoidales bacterium]
MGRLETIDLTYVYPTGIRALDQVNFVADTGQFVLLLGPNGSGKTTLFRHFSGSLHPASGKVLVDGREVGKGDLNWLYRSLGFVFQDPNDQLFAATVGEDVAFGPRNAGLPPAEVETRVKRCLEMVGLPGFERRPIHALSFGQKRRVALAGVLALRPEIIILDEPTAGLDPMGASRMMDLLYRLKHDQGVTILMATHDIDFVPRYADLVYVLRHGHIVASGTPAEVFAQAQVIHESELRLPRAAQALQLVGEELGYSLEGLPFTLDEPMAMVAAMEDPARVVRRSDGHLAGPAAEYPVSLGAAAAAASLAAVELLFHGRTMPDVELRSPLGAVARVPVSGVQELMVEEHRVAVASAASDPRLNEGGVAVEVRAEARERTGFGIEIVGGRGIGHTHVATDGGELERPAISPLVHQMIADAVRAALPETAGVMIVLSVPGGEQMARRGLGRADVVDGISLAGAIWPSLDKKPSQPEANSTERATAAMVPERVLLRRTRVKRLGLPMGGRRTGRRRRPRTELSASQW